MRINPRRLWLLVATLMLVAVIVFFARPQSVTGHVPARAHAATAREVPASPAAAASTRGAVPPPSASTPTPEAAVPNAPLPALDAPLRTVLADLRSKAAAGDGAAACRVAAEFSLCERLPGLRADYDRWLADRQLALKSIDSEQLRAEAAARIGSEMDLRTAQVDALAGHCDGVKVPSSVENFGNWRRAAHLGNPAAVKHYASGNAFRWRDIPQMFPELETYKRDGEALALSQARHGDVELALALAAAYDAAALDWRTLLARIVKPDPPLSLAIYLKLERELPASDPDLAQLRQAIEIRRTELESRLGQDDLARGRDPAYRGIDRWQRAVVNGGTPSLRAGLVRDMPTQSCAWEN